MDTAHDYRFLVAEEALNRIEQRIKTWSLPYPLNKIQALEIVKSIRSTLMKLKYSFLPVDMLIKMSEFQELEQRTKELASMVLPPKSVKIDTVSQRLIVSELKWALSILLGLRSRVALGEENLPEYAIDIIGVEIGYVEKHPKAKKLWITKAGTESFTFTIVTNIPNIRRGEVRGAAILPPTTFFDVVSEAMFCTDPLDASYKGKRIPRELIHRAEIINVVESIVRGVRK